MPTFRILSAFDFGRCKVKFEGRNGTSHTTINIWQVEDVSVWVRLLRCSLAYLIPKDDELCGRAAHSVTQSPGGSDQLATPAYSTNLVLFV
ncbi:hypothetical protein RUM43_011989, partial [Polyplax serrata]